MRPLAALLLAASAVAAAAPSPFKDVNPAVFAPDDPRAKDLPKTLSADVRRRLQDANARESKAFAAVTTREQWEAFRDQRIKALRDSLGTFPPPPKDMPLRVAGRLEGDGYRVENLLYETRPGVWVDANLYLPAKAVDSMPGIVIAHSHHNPRREGELQDMGMTWARAGCAVLVPEHLGHGERRAHDFRTEKDYPKPFRVSRQDYQFRHNTGIQLHLLGDSLMGWMAWDLMRGVDVLLNHAKADPKRIILLGAVAGGGDPAGMTAALDPRVSAVVPFNFGGGQPDYATPDDTDRNFYWFGQAHWEGTRGLRLGARDGFAHWVIVGSVAPRSAVLAHEFAWEADRDPAWPRLQKVFGFYGAADKLSFSRGRGSVRGTPPDSTHCNNIGEAHRAGFYPAFEKWFGMPVPKEYKGRRTGDELACWTPALAAELKPKRPHEAFAAVADERLAAARKSPADAKSVRGAWANLLGDIEPAADVKPSAGAADHVGDAALTRFTLETDPGVLVPAVLLTPANAAGKSPVVVMVAQAGKAAFLNDRGAEIAELLKAGVAVCLPDARGTGETRLTDSSPGRSGSRTGVSSTESLLGQTLVGSRLKDLRAVIRYLGTRPDVDGKRMAVWGDSFAPVNPPDRTLAVPHDAPDTPNHAEPLGGLLALFAALYEPDAVKAVYARGGLTSFRSVLDSPYVYIPHDATVPGAIAAGDLDAVAAAVAPRPLRLDSLVTAQNVAATDADVKAAYARARGAYKTGGFETGGDAGAAAWVAKQVGGK